MSYKTIPDVDDGFGDRTSACREYTLPREDQNSTIYATIPGQTIIGPVLQVLIIRYLDISGIEIQISSTTTKDRTSWVVMCRGEKQLRGGVGQGRWGPQGMLPTGGGGLARVPNLRVCHHSCSGGGPRRGRRAN